MNVIFDPAPMRGVCEICFDRCGDKGAVQIVGTPLQIGRGCAAKIADALQSKSSAPRRKQARRVP